jgi:hypothetical protein
MHAGNGNGGLLSLLQWLLVLVLLLLVPSQFHRTMR